MRFSSSEKKADAAQDSTAVATEQVAAAPEEGANADLNDAFENFDMNQASLETKAKLEKMQELK